MRPLIKQESKENAHIEDTPPAYKNFLNVLALVERLHRLLLDVIKDELSAHQQHDINAVQALLLYHIGPNEHSASDLRLRGYYQGSNVSYNLKKLVENDFVVNETNLADRRAIRIRLTPKGEGLRVRIEALYEKLFSEIIGENYWLEKDCFSTRDSLIQLERLFRGHIIE